MTLQSVRLRQGRLIGFQVDLIVLRIDGQQLTVHGGVRRIRMIVLVGYVAGQFDAVAFEFVGDRHVTGGHVAWQRQVIAGLRCDRLEVSIKRWRTCRGERILIISMSKTILNIFPPGFLV